MPRYERKKAMPINRNLPAIPSPTKPPAKIKRQLPDGQRKQGEIEEVIEVIEIPLEDEEGQLQEITERRTKYGSLVIRAISINDHSHSTGLPHWHFLMLYTKAVATSLESGKRYFASFELQRHVKDESGDGFLYQQSLDVCTFPRLPEGNYHLAIYYDWWDRNTKQSVEKTREEVISVFPGHQAVIDYQ